MSANRPKGTPFIITYNVEWLSRPLDLKHRIDVTRAWLSWTLARVMAEGGELDKDGKVKDKATQADIDLLNDQMKECESLVELYYPHMDSGDVDDLEGAKEDMTEVDKRVWRVYSILARITDRYDLIDYSNHAESYGGGFGVIKDRE
jgi:hypothetical protein